MLASLSNLVYAQAFVMERTLSAGAAMEAATAALDQCRKDGYLVTITVLNRAGRTTIVLHDDGASPYTIENSLRKAHTALMYRVPSGDIGKRVAANPALAGVLHLDKITSLDGGLPISVGNDVVGAIGISGSPTGAKDAVCAQVGIDRISKGLSAN
jgi:uncharacterized protein GlcG (DUF336 family)